MPLTHTRTFRVRHYECDAYGHVNNAVYLHYMQAAAFDASAAAGYDMARYEAMGRLWFVRETDIEYLAPLRYGDTLTVKTWVADFRRVRSRRMYRLRNADTDEPVARAHTDWVFLAHATGRPMTIPGELINTFFPNGLPATTPAHEPFPKAPPPPPGVITRRRQVAFNDVDPAQHVNNAVYLTWAEDAIFTIMAERGWPVDRCTEHGFAIVVRRQRIKYKQQARLGDELEIATWFSGLKRASAARHYTITRVSDGALMTRIHTLAVWVDVETGRPIRVPTDFLADFASNMA